MLCACGNAARYITSRGVYTCSICPLKNNHDSVKLSSVPWLLTTIRRMLKDPNLPPRWSTDLREILGRDIEGT